MALLDGAPSALGGGGVRGGPAGGIVKSAPLDPASKTASKCTQRASVPDGGYGGARVSSIPSPGGGGAVAHSALRGDGVHTGSIDDIAGLTPAPPGGIGHGMMTQRFSMFSHDYIDDDSASDDRVLARCNERSLSPDASAALLRLERCLVGTTDEQRLPPAASSALLRLEHYLDSTTEMLLALRRAPVERHGYVVPDSYDNSSPRAG